MLDLSSIVNSLISSIKTWFKNFFNKGFFRNDKVGFFAIMFLSLLIIIFRGNYSSEGQGSIFKGFLTRYIEETSATAIALPVRNQLSEINSVMAYSGKDQAPRPSTLNTIQGNSVVSRGTILTDIFDEFTDRGTQVATYTVQEGDTLSFIAKDYGVSVNTIIWANHLKSSDDIRPGVDLKIPPVNGVIHRVTKGDTVELIAKKYSVDKDKIISFNLLPQDGNLQDGEELMIPNGRIQSPSTVPGQQSTAKRFAYLPNLADLFFIPTTGYNWGRVHGRNGVDVANSCGTPVYAAADGPIVLAKASGWNGGFGKVVRITHSNGTETLYAHLSQLLVDAGQIVAKGQEIGLMGTTGNSTGCHLHFEVHGAKNPLAKN